MLPDKAGHVIGIDPAAPVSFLCFSFLLNAVEAALLYVNLAGFEPLWMPTAWQLYSSSFFSSFFDTVYDEPRLAWDLLCTGE